MLLKDTIVLLSPTVYHAAYVFSLSVEKKRSDLNKPGAPTNQRSVLVFRCFKTQNNDNNTLLQIV